MAKYVSRVKQCLDSFSVWKLEHVPRDCNDKANALAIVAASLPITETIFLPIGYQPFSLIAPSQVSQVNEILPSWMDPIIHYISTGELPSEKDKAHKVQVQSGRFSLIDGKLFRRSLGSPYLKCLMPEQGHYVLVELYEGICGNHLGGKNFGTQGSHSRVLLADHESRCCQFYQKI